MRSSSNPATRTNSSTTAPKIFSCTSSRTIRSASPRISPTARSGWCDRRSAARSARSRSTISIAKSRRGASGILAAGHGPDNEKRLGPRRDRFGQRRVGRIVRQIALAREEPNERAAATRGAIADRSSQHRIARFQRIEQRTLRRPTGYVDLHLAVGARQGPQMGRQHHADHVSVCTSTESTGGKSRTIAVQVSPASADAYT